MNGRRLACILGPLFPAIPAASPASARDGDEAVEGAVGPYGERLRYDARGLSLTFPDEEVKLQVGGRLHVDGGAVGLSRPGLPGAFPDSVAVRRAWIEPTLTIGKDWVVAFQRLRRPDAAHQRRLRRLKGPA